MPNKLVRWISSGVQACASCLRPSDVKEGVPKTKESSKRRKRRHFWMIRKSNKVGPDPRKENKTPVPKPKEEKDPKAASPAKSAKKSVKSPKPKSKPSCEGCKPHSPRSIKARLLKKLKTAKDELQTASNDASIEPNTRIPCAQSDVVKVKDGEKVKVNDGDKKVNVKDDDKKVKVDGDKKAKIEDDKPQVEDANVAVCEDDYGGKVASYVASVVTSAFDVVASTNDTDNPSNNVILGYSDLISDLAAEYVGHDENSVVAQGELNDGVVNDKGSVNDVSCAEIEVGLAAQTPREDHEVDSDCQIVKTSSEPQGSLEKNPTPRANSYAGLILNIADVIGGMKTSSYQSRARLIGEMFGGIHQRNESLYRLVRNSMYAPTMPAHSEQAVSTTRGSGDVDKADHSTPLSSKSPLVGERPEEFQAIRHKPPRSPMRPA